jgi:hypothetical protein
MLSDVSWTVATMLAAGTACLVLGIHVRRGKSRSFYPYYQANVYWGLWGATAVVFVLWLALGWPSGVLVVLGSAIFAPGCAYPQKAKGI